MIKNTLFLFFCLFLGGISLVEGDILILKKGGKVEGEITFKKGKYRVRTSYGMVFTCSPKEVLRIVRTKKKKTSSPKMGSPKIKKQDKIKKGETSLDRWIAAKRKIFSPGDVRQRIALAKFCESKKMPALARELYREVIGIQPNHYGARFALGYVRYKGAWMIKKDFLKKIGYATHKGKWISQKDREKLIREKKMARQFSRIRQKVRQTLLLGTARQKKELLPRLNQAYSPASLVWSCRKLLRDPSPRVRFFALDYLRSRSNRDSLNSLVYVMLKDSSKAVRIRAYQTVKSLGGPSSYTTILNSLSNPNPTVRFAALGAVNAFKIKKALPILYSRANDLSSGGGGLYLPRQHAFFGTYRAYIKAWELGSAGTQQQGQEVPDPIIDTFFEGVVIETQLVSIEYILVRRTIHWLRR